MVNTCIVSQCGNKQKRWSSVRFHHIPTADQDRMRRWLITLNIDPNTAVEMVKKMLVCSEHFLPEDYGKNHLNGSAIPSVGIPETADLDKSKNESVHTGSGCDAESFDFPRMKSHAVQTLPLTQTGRSMPTQSTEAKLRARFFQNKAIQVTGASIDLNIQRHLYGHQRSSTKRESVQAPRPSKRARREEEEEVVKGVRERGEREGSREEEEKEEEAECSEDLDDSDASFEDSMSESLSCASDEPELNELRPAELEDSKYVVFESRLKELFDSCPVCMHPCVVQKRRSGSFVSFAQDCPHCLYSRQWQSQPVVGSSPAGDLQLSAAVYFSGGSFTKVRRICKAMNLQIHKPHVFRRHCRSLLEPSVFHQWKTEQEGFVQELKRKGRVGVSCEMTEDSSGQSGSYTITELQSNQILDMQLIPRRAFGGRIQMEKEGLGRGLDFLKSSGLKVDQIVTDRHPQIQKYLCESGIIQNNSVRCQKEISRESPELSGHRKSSVQEKNLAEAERTNNINKIQDGRSEHPPHPVKWRRDLRDVKKLSSERQTSFEARQRIIRRFLSRKFILRDVSRKTRLFLAGMHHNENAKRELTFSDQKVFFTESKNDVITAKQVKTQPSFDYVTSLMRLVFSEVLPELPKFVEQQRTTLLLSPLTKTKLVVRNIQAGKYHDRQIPKMEFTGFSCCKS